MTTARTKAVPIVCLFLCVAGCSHKNKPVQPPPQAQAPIAPPSSIAKASPLPPVPPPPQVDVTLAKPEQPEKKPAKRHATHRKPKSTPPEQPAPSPAEQTQTPAAATAQTAAAGEPPSASPIGQLTTSSSSANTPSRQSVVDLIDSTEKGLRDVKRTLNADEQTTVVQIRTFLAKAKDALSANDLDGASTLATKAHVLLQELTKE